MDSTAIDVAVETKTEAPRRDPVEVALAMSVPYVPLFDRVLVKPIAPEEMHKGLIIIPDNAKERSQAGVVLATGPGLQTRDGFIAAPVTRGDIVLFGKFSGFEVGVEKLSEIAGGEIISDVESLMVVRAQEIMLVRAAAAPQKIGI